MSLIHFVTRSWKTKVKSRIDGKDNQFNRNQFTTFKLLIR